MIVQDNTWRHTCSMEHTMRVSHNIHQVEQQPMWHMEMKFDTISQSWVELRLSVQKIISDIITQTERRYTCNRVKFSKYIKNGAYTYTYCIYHFISRYWHRSQTCIDAFVKHCTTWCMCSITMVSLHRLMQTKTRPIFNQWTIHEKSNEWVKTYTSSATRAKVRICRLSITIFECPTNNKTLGSWFEFEGTPVDECATGTSFIWRSGLTHEVQ